MEFLCLIGAAGLASGLMLAWAAAASIPILLHFLYRRRQKIVPWAAVQLLLQVVQQESRRIRIEQLLLLMLRVMIPIVLSLALARPYWQTEDTDPSGLQDQVETMWIFAVDVSYSMGYRADQLTRLQAAQQRVAEVVQSASRGDAFALVAFADPARGVIAKPTFDRDSTLAAVGGLSLVDTGADVQGGLQIVSDLGRLAVDSPELPDHVRVMILSDLGREDWETAIDGSAAELLRELTATYPTEIVSLADPNPSNVAIVSLAVSSVQATVDRPLNVDVLVENYGDQTVRRLPVQLTVDGQTIASQYVDLSQGDPKLVRFEVTLNAPGQSVITASIPLDHLTADDSRSQVIEVNSGLDVLFLEQQAGDARLLQLSLGSASSSRPAQRSSSVSVLELPAVRMNQWQVIVFVDVPQLDVGGYARLDRYVRQGGAVLFVFGPRTQASPWTALESDRSLLGFALTEPSVLGDWTLDPLEYRSPVVAPFAGFPDSGLLTTPVFRYWQITPLSPPADLVVDLALDNGDPLVVRRRLGQGYVAGFLSAPSTGAAPQQAWNAIATWPSFVPLMQSLIQSLVGGNIERRTVLAGRPIAGSVPASDADQVITVIKPDGSESQIAPELTTEVGTAPWVFGPTQRQGVYLVRHSTGNEEFYAVNLNPSGSSLRSASTDELPQAAPMAALHEEVRQRGMTEVAESSSPLARSALLVLGGLLVIESLLAWAIGRRAR
jgi:hypothetical protein